METEDRNKYLMLFITAEVISIMIAIDVALSCKKEPLWIKYTFCSHEIIHEIIWSNDCLRVVVEVGHAPDECIFTKCIKTYSSSLSSSSSSGPVLFDRKEERSAATAAGEGVICFLTPASASNASNHISA
jgi:hypothetical protein